MTNDTNDTNGTNDTHHAHDTPDIAVDPIAPRAPAVFEYYTALGYTVAVGTDVPSAQAAVQRVLGGFGPIDDPPAGDVPRYELIVNNTGCQLALNDAVVYPEDPIHKAELLSVLGTLEFQFVSTALERREDFFHLHGAALCLPTRRAGIVLAGESRSGKTTLAMGLMLRGFFPYTDDVVLIDPERLELHAMPRAFHVVPDTATVLAPLAGGLPAIDDGPVGFFLPPQWATAPVPVKWILFPEYVPGQTPQLIRLTPAEAASAILTRTTTLSRLPKLALSTASRLIEQAACYRFPTGDLAASVALVQQLVAAT